MLKPAGYFLDRSKLRSILPSTILTLRTNRPKPRAPPHKGAPHIPEFIYFLGIFIGFLSYNFSKNAKNAKFCQENRENSPCTSFRPHFWPNVQVLFTQPPNRIIENYMPLPYSFSGPPTRSHGPRAPKLLRMALVVV